MSITEKYASCYKAITRNWSQQIKVINYWETTWGEKHFLSELQESQSHVQQRKSVSDWTNVLTPQVHKIIYRNAVFSGGKKKNKKAPKQLWKSLTRQHRWNPKFNILFCPEVGAEQRRISSFFERPALARRADLSPLLKSVGTGIFETGHDLLKGQGQLKTHISGRAYYCQ